MSSKQLFSLALITLCYTVSAIAQQEPKREITQLETYKNWGQYDTWLPLNIEGMYNQIRLHRRGN